MIYGCYTGRMGKCYERMILKSQNDVILKTEFAVKDSDKKN